MTTTPEGKVKILINKALDEYRDRIYVFMPVPGGYGKSSLDYLGCLGGQMFAVEAKAPGKAPTDRQEGIIEAMQAAGVSVFVVDGESTLRALVAWLRAVDDVLFAMSDTE